MTVLAPENDRRNQYIATGGQTVFAYDFYIGAATDLEVFQNTTLLVHLTNYTVSNVGVVGGGNVTLVVGATLNDRITIEADTPQVRSTDFTTSNFKSAALNLQLDDNVRLSQEQERDLGRSAVLPVHVLDSVDVTLPVPSAGKAIAWNDDADGLVNVVIPGSSNAIEGPDPAVSTNNAIVRWDGVTGRLVQDSNVLIDNSDNITGVGTLTGSGAVTMGVGTNANSQLGRVKIGSVISDTLAIAHEDRFTATGKALSQGATGNTVLNSETSGTTFLTIGNVTQVTITNALFTISSNDLVLTAGGLDVEGVIEAGTLDIVLTNVDGTIRGAAINSAIAGAGITYTAGVLSVALGAGDVTGPSSSTDEAFARFDSTTGKLLQNGVVLASNTGAITGVTTLVMSSDLTLTGATSVIKTDTIGDTLDLQADAGISNIVLSGAVGSELANVAGKLIMDAGQILADFGTAGAPGYAFAGETNLGMFRIGAGNLGLSVGSLQIDITTSNVTIPTNNLVLTAGDLTVTAGDLLLSAGTAHIISGSSGATADTGADDLIVESNSVGGISILTPNASLGRIFFGTPADNIGAFIQWLHDSSIMNVGSAKVGATLELEADNSVTNLALSGILGSERCEVKGLLNFSGTLGASSVDPSTHVGVDDWLEVEIGGTSFFAPLYNVT